MSSKKEIVPHKTSKLRSILSKFRSKPKTVDPVAVAEKKSKKNSIFSFKSEKTEEKPIKDNEKVITNSNDKKNSSKNVNKENDLKLENEKKYGSIDLNLSDNELKVSGLSVPPLNNSMAKSKIRAASRKKPISRNPNLTSITEPLEIIEEVSDSPLVAELKKQKRSSLIRKSSSIEHEIKLTHSNSEDLGRISSSLMRSNTNNETKNNNSLLNSKENLRNISSENLIDATKKSLKNIKSDGSTNLIYTNENHHHNSNPNTPLKKTNENLITTSNKASSQQNLTKVSNESIICVKSCESTEKLKSNNSNDSSVSMATSSIQNFCSFISTSSGSSNNSSTEKINKSNKIDNDGNSVPIYDNFTLPNRVPEIEIHKLKPVEKKLEKQPSVTESFVYRLNKKHHENKSYTKNKMSMADKDPSEELKIFIKSKLRQSEPPSNLNNKDEELNQVNALIKKTSSTMNNSVEQNNAQSTKKLTHSKSLRLDNMLETVPAPRNGSVTIQNNPNIPYKLVLKTKNENSQPVNVEKQNVPLKKISDRIKDLNNVPKSPPSENQSNNNPPWKDLVMKKKNVWNQDDKSANESSTDTTELHKFASKPPNKVKSIILGLEEK